jgi:hypothetical protein
MVEFIENQQRIRIIFTKTINCTNGLSQRIRQKEYRTFYADLVHFFYLEHSRNKQQYI